LTYSKLLKLFSNTLSKDGIDFLTLISALHFGTHAYDWSYGALSLYSVTLPILSASDVSYLSSLLSEVGVNAYVKIGWFSYYCFYNYLMVSR